MPPLFLGLLAVAPSVLLLAYTARRCNRPVITETVGESLFTGAVIGFPIIGVLYFSGFVFGPGAISLDSRTDSIAMAYLAALLLAGIPEEAAKFAAVWLFTRSHPSRRGAGDLLLSTVAVGLGFAALENIFYVVRAADGLDRAIIRALTAVPTHFTLALIMGGFLVAAEQAAPQSRRKLLWLAFLGPALLHGIYNGVLMSSGPALSGAERAALDRVVFTQNVKWMATLTVLGVAGLLALELVARRETGRAKAGARVLWFAIGLAVLATGIMGSRSLDPAIARSISVIRVDGTVWRGPWYSRGAYAVLPGLIGLSMMVYGLRRPP